MKKKSPQNFLDFYKRNRWKKKKKSRAAMYCTDCGVSCVSCGHSIVNSSTPRGMVSNIVCRGKSIPSMIRDDSGYIDKGSTSFSTGESGRSSFHLYMNLPASPHPPYPGPTGCRIQKYAQRSMNGDNPQVTCNTIPALHPSIRGFQVTIAMSCVEALRGLFHFSK